MTDLMMSIKLILIIHVYNIIVVHTIKVEPMSVGLEQSMQYNELYVPSTPRPRPNKSKI